MHKSMKTKKDVSKGTKKVRDCYDYALWTLWIVVGLASFAMLIAIVQGLVCRATHQSYFHIEDDVCVHYTVHDDCWFHSGVRREEEYSFFVDDGGYYYFDMHGWKHYFQPCK